MRTIALAALLLSLPAGCAGDGGTHISGVWLNGDRFELTTARFGVFVDHGTHAEQIAGKPPEASLKVELTGDSDQPVTLWGLALATGEQVVQDAYATDVDVDAVVQLDAIGVGNLPEGPETWAPPFEGVTGSIEGSVTLSFHGHGGDYYVGQASGRFAAEHGADLDAAVTE